MPRELRVEYSGAIYVNPVVLTGAPDCSLLP